MIRASILHTGLPLKVDKDLREYFLPGKAEDAAWRKAGRKDCLILMETILFENEDLIMTSGDDDYNDGTETPEKT